MTPATSNKPSAYNPAPLRARGRRLSLIAAAAILAAGVSFCGSAYFQHKAQAPVPVATISSIHVPEALKAHLPAVAPGANTAPADASAQARNAAFESVAQALVGLLKPLGLFAGLLLVVMGAFRFLSGSHTRALSGVTFTLCGVMMMFTAPMVQVMFGDMQSAAAAAGTAAPWSPREALDYAVEQHHWADVLKVATPIATPLQRDYLTAQMALIARNHQDLMKVADNVSAHADDPSIAGKPKALYVIELNAYGAARSGVGEAYVQACAETQASWTGWSRRLFVLAVLLLLSTLPSGSLGIAILRRAQRIDALLLRTAAPALAFTSR